MGKCSGVQVGEITQRTNSSRSTVSHHLQILKAAGIIKVRRKGTKNYNYFDPQMETLEQLVTILQMTIAISKGLPNRSGEDM